MLYVVVNSHFVWIHEFAPRVVFFKQTLTLFIIIDAAETLFVSVRYFVLRKLLDFAHFLQVDIGCRSLFL